MIKRTLPVMGSMLLFAAITLPGIAQDQGSKPTAEQGSGTQELKASDMVTTTATVQEIDKAKRTVTLKGEGGNTVEVKVGENVKNFDQIKKGDQVKAAYYQSAAISIRKPGDPPAQTGEKETVLAPESGEAPGKAVIKTVQAAATVEKIDKEKREVTLKGPEGKSKTIKVKDESKDLDRIQTG